MKGTGRRETDDARIERVRKMEQYLDDAATALRGLETALDGYDAALPGLRKLAAYYDSGEWRRDFEADEAGLLPAGLKRGVLSEVAVYDLLTAHGELLRRIQGLSESNAAD